MIYLLNRFLKICLYRSTNAKIYHFVELYKRKNDLCAFRG